MPEIPMRLRNLMPLVWVSVGIAVALVGLWIVAEIVSSEVVKVMK
jgi:hypothetical protein